MQSAGAQQSPKKGFRFKLANLAPAKTQKGSIDVTFLILVLLLLTFGLVMMFSASYANAYYNENDSFYYIRRQLVWAAVGLIAMIFASLFDYRWFSKLAIPAYVLSLVMLVVVLFMPKVNNARRWILIPPNHAIISFQPSEIAKFAIVILFARLIVAYQDKGKMGTFKYGIMPFAVLLGIVGILMILEPHLSGTILIFTIGIIMMYVGGTNIKWFGFALLAVAAALIVMVMFTDFVSYAESRINHWLDPFQDPRGKGFQTIQSLYAIGSGGLMGLGLGNSRQKYLYIPEPQNDFVFAIVCEELGFVGATIIVILFALLVWRGFVIALRARDRYGSLLAVGLTAQVGIQALLNIAVVTNTIPNTGISLPFFSYGGTSLMMLLAEMGVILSVSRTAHLEKE